MLNETALSALVLSEVRDLLMLQYQRDPNYWFTVPQIKREMMSKCPAIYHAKLTQIITVGLSMSILGVEYSQDSSGTIYYQLPH